MDREGAEGWENRIYPAGAPLPPTPTPAPRHGIQDTLLCSPRPKPLCSLHCMVHPLPAHSSLPHGDQSSLLEISSDIRVNKHDVFLSGALCWAVRWRGCRPCPREVRIRFGSSYHQTPMAYPALCWLLGGRGRVAIIAPQSSQMQKLKSTDSRSSGPGSNPDSAISYCVMVN